MLLYLNAGASNDGVRCARTGRTHTYNVTHWSAFRRVLVPPDALCICTRVRTFDRHRLLVSSSYSASSARTAVR